MKIKDIVNREHVTLTNCEHEPIHIPGQIQPHGFLMGLTEDRKVDFCSGNISWFVSVAHTDALGKKFGDVFGEQAEQLLFEYIDRDKIKDVFPLEIELLGKFFQINIHKSNNVYVLEAEFQFAGKEIGS